MISYNQAFDYYHSIYRIMLLLVRCKEDTYIEVDRIRIWDFYVLFPSQIHTIKQKNEETDIKAALKLFSKKNNPYIKVHDPSIVFDRIRPYQMIALHCLASYGIISMEKLQESRVLITSLETLKRYVLEFDSQTNVEYNVTLLMTSYYSNISLFGPDGLKSRTKLMTSRYDV